MTGHGLLQELVLVYALAVLLLLFTVRLRVPSIVVLIGAGVIAGPAGFGLIGEQEDVELLSEIGVALLLFTAGLEFSVTEMRRVWRSLLPGGLGQVGLTTVLAAGMVLLMTGGSVGRAGLLGLFVTLSSTAVVLKELARRNHMHAPHGRLATGVLLLQDLVVIAVLAATPTLLGETLRGGVGGALLTLAIAGAGLVLIGRVLLPRLLGHAAAISREVFALAVLLASVGTAWLAAFVGLSMAAGAFLAGLVLAESEFSHQVHADVRPLRDLLSSLFFISIGMLVDVRVLLPILPATLALAAGIMVLKFGAGAGALVLARTPVRVALGAAIALSQVGEFSFVLGRAGVDAGLIPGEWWQLLLGASVITMAITPYLVGAAPELAARLAARAPAAMRPPLTHLGLRGHVVILGYGAGGQLIAKSLMELSVGYVVLELNGATVQRARRSGVRIQYADATAVEPLEAADVRDAAAVVAVLSDPDASARAVRTVRSLAPDVPIIARSRYQLEAEGLAQAGATLAVAEEMEATLEVLSHLLARLHLPGNVAETLMDHYRRGVTAPGGRPMRAPSVPLDQMPAELSATPIASLRLDEHAWASGRTLQEIDLRAATGATVLAIRRAGDTTTAPSSTFALAAGDDIFLMGDASDVMLARARLVDGPRDNRRPPPVDRAHGSNV